VHNRRALQLQGAKIIEMHGVTITTQPPGRKAGPPIPVTGRCAWAGPRLAVRSSRRRRAQRSHQFPSQVATHCGTSCGGAHRIRPRG
jgi:hypothetical protein